MRRATFEVIGYPLETPRIPSVPKTNDVIGEDHITENHFVQNEMNS